MPLLPGSRHHGGHEWHEDRDDGELLTMVMVNGCIRHTTNELSATF
jgi:hypothetical protein